MPFPFSIRGSIPIPHDSGTVSDRAIISACIEQVEDEGARVVSRSDRSTAFTSPIFRRLGSNWRFTVPLSGGSFEITADTAGGRRLRYDVSTRRTALMGIVLLGAWFAVVIALDAGRFPWWIGAVFWLSIVGVNYFIPFVRAPGWLRQRLSDAATQASLAAAAQHDLHIHSPFSRR